MAVNDNRTKFTANSEYNALYLMIRNHLLTWVSTAEVVIVTEVEEPSGTTNPVGYCTVKPLVCQVDAKGERIEPVQLFRLPYFRLQGGICALVMDPVPGDIGIAVYTKRDSTLVEQEQSEPVRPGSFRVFSQSDGFYLGGFLNKVPEVYVEMTQDKVINIQCDNANIVAAEKVTIDSPLAEFTGDVIVRGDLDWYGDSTGHGNGVSRAQDHISNSISGNSHVHGGVQSGGSTTQGPR